MDDRKCDESVAAPPASHSIISEIIVMIPLFGLYKGTSTNTTRVLLSIQLLSRRYCMRSAAASLSAGKVSTYLLKGAHQRCWPRYPRPHPRTHSLAHWLLRAHTRHSLLEACTHLSCTLQRRAKSTTPRHARFRRAPPIETRPSRLLH